MFRKVFPLAIACSAFAALAIAPTAFGHGDDPGCNGYDKDPHGIYASSTGSVGKFKLSTSPTTANTASKLTASALLCGTNPGSGDYFASATLVYPNKGEKVTCARKNPPVDRCDLDGNGSVANGSENIPSGRFMGYATTDSWCGDDLCVGGNEPQPNVYAETFVKTAADGNTHCNDASSTQVACEQTIALIFGGLVTCKSDVIINRVKPLADATGKYTLTMYQPACNIGDTEIGPVYVDGIDSVTVCKNATTEPAMDGTCGVGGNASFKNGNAGSYTWNLSVNTVGTGGLDNPETATANGSWT